MEKAIQTSQSSNGFSLKDRIRVALAQMATFRQATLDASTLKLYSARLASEQFEDVIAALEKLQEMPRAEGETAIPAIATVLEMVKVAAIARHNRESAAHDLEHVAWECRTCQGTCGDFYPISRDVASEVRYCQRPSQRPGATFGEICGGDLAVAHRERADRRNGAAA